MNKKMFTRLGLTITNICNQRCPWCFEGDWKKTQEKHMSLDDVEKLLKWKDWTDGFNPVIYLLGGEPTLHPQLIEMIDMIQNYNRKISIMLLTNMTCNRDMLEKLLEHRVIIFANIDQFEESNNQANWPIIRQNLHYLNNNTPLGFRYNISATVSRPDKDFTFLYEILEQGKSQIYNLRLAPSCIGLGYKNEFPKFAGEDYYITVKNVLDRCLKIKPDLHLSTECAVNGCTISKELFNTLKEMGYHLRYTCGVPEPNADILPDLSSHWCFAFEDVAEMKVSNVLDYPSYNAMLEALKEKYCKLNQQVGLSCHRKDCSNTECQGPCAALNYYYNKIKERK